MQINMVQFPITTTDSSDLDSGTRGMVQELATGWTTQLLPISRFDESSDQILSVTIPTGPS